MDSTIFNANTYSDQTLDLLIHFDIIHLVYDQFELFRVMDVLGYSRKCFKAISGMVVGGYSVLGS